MSHVSYLSEIEPVSEGPGSRLDEVALHEYPRIVKSVLASVLHGLAHFVKKDNLPLGKLDQVIKDSGKDILYEEEGD